MNECESTEARLKEIERELRELTGERDALRAHWQVEKELISSIRKMKSDIEQAKTDAANYERAGDLAKVAELRYGTIMTLERELAAANDKLAAAQRDIKMLKEEVDAEDIAEIVGKWTGIPLTRLVETERTKLLRMEDQLHEHIIGQDEAVSAVSNAIRRSRAGLQDARRPVGSFIFLGSTGVGKTELARALAEFLFDDEHAMVRIDMSEYMEKFSVSRLIGAPPGYVGYEEGGQLTEAVRRRPYSVILLDEIEKAHPEVFNLLLQVLDDGRLTDSQGRTVDFKNTIIIMTSNIGSHLIAEKLAGSNPKKFLEEFGELRSILLEFLREKIRPEFLNRIDEIVLFKPLTEEDIRKIVDVQLRSVRDMLAKDNIIFTSTDEANDWLGKLGYDISYGARPLKRTIQKYVTNPLSEKILAGEITAGTHVKLRLNKQGLITFDIKRV